MKLNLLVIRTNDIHDLVEFYKLLGLEFEYHRHGKGAYHYASTIDGLTFEIYPLLKHQKEVDNSLRLGFEVVDLDKLIAELQVKNVNILNPPKLQEWSYTAIIPRWGWAKNRIKRRGDFVV